MLDSNSVSSRYSLQSSVQVGVSAPLVPDGIEVKVCQAMTLLLSTDVAHPPRRAVGKGHGGAEGLPPGFADERDDGDRAGGGLGRLDGGDGECRGGGESDQVGSGDDLESVSETATVTVTMSV